MNTYKFPKYPGSKTWAIAKHEIETDQTLPALPGTIHGKFNGQNAVFMPILERVSGDTHLNEVKAITGFVVQTNDYIRESGHYIQEVYKPENIHLLYSFEGYHLGCSAKCCCQVIKDDNEYIKHRSTCRKC